MSQEPAPTDAELQLLPPVLRLVAVASGMGAALRLVEQRGGVPLYVPHEARPDHPLVAIIGLAGLQALCNVYPGEPITLPMAAAALRFIRNQRMRAERSDKSIRDLALGYKMTRRRVQQLMAEGCGQLPEDQGDMFG